MAMRKVLDGVIHSLDWEIGERRCSILVTRFVVHEGSYSCRAASDLDFHGWVEVDYRLSEDGKTVSSGMEAMVTPQEDKRILRHIREELCEWA